MEGDKTLQQLFDEKLDTEGLDSEALKTLNVVESPEYHSVVLDKSNKIIEGLKTNGIKTFEVNCEFKKNLNIKEDITVFGKINNTTIENKINAKSNSIVFSPSEVSYINSIGGNVIATRDGINNCVSIPLHIHEKMTLRLKVEFPTDVHIIEQDAELLRLSNGSEYGSVVLRKRPAQFNSETIMSMPVPTYKAGIVTGHDSSFAGVIADGFNRELLLGSDTMAFRFKGDCNVAANQDICIEITDSIVRIFHSTNNSDIQSYTLNQYATLEDLYQAIKSDCNAGGVLDDFEIKFLTLDNKIPTDLIPGKARLVSRYYGDKEHTTEFWDAFPFYFTSKEEGRIYTIEVLIDKNNSVPNQLLIDGYGCIFGGYSADVFSGTSATLIINDPLASSGIKVHSIEIFDGEAKSVFPLSKVVYAEGVYDGITSTVGKLSSEEKMAGTFNLYKNNNFKSVGFEDIVALAEGKTLSNDRVFHVSHDDHAVNVMTDSNLRELYLRNGIRPSFGMHLDVNLTNNEKEIISALRGDDFTCIVHTGVTTLDGQTIGKRDIGCCTYNELVAMVNATIDKFVSEYGYFPVCWDYHHETETYNTSRFLKNKGFKLIFGLTKNGGVNPINRWRCKRITSRDSTDYSVLTEHINDYLC